MTNRDKFEEVFGIKLTKELVTIPCDYVECDDPDRGVECPCKVTTGFRWDDEYVPVDKPVNEIFPKETIGAKIGDMPNDIYETYCMSVFCNSMNAVEGSCIRKRIEGVEDGNKVLSWAANHLNRAQGIIWFLLEESGRYDRLEKWRKK